MKSLTKHYSSDGSSIYCRKASISQRWDAPMAKRGGARMARRSQTGKWSATTSPTLTKPPTVRALPVQASQGTEDHGHQPLLMVVGCGLPLFIFAPKGCSHNETRNKRQVILAVYRCAR